MWWKKKYIYFVSYFWCDNKGQSGFGNCPAVTLTHKITHEDIHNIENNLKNMIKAEVVSVIAFRRY